MNVLILLGKNLFLTVLIEGALVLVLKKRGRTLYHSVLINVLTNPILNLILLFLANFIPLPTVPYYYIVMALLEVTVVITEGYLYYKMRDFCFKKAFFASLVLNTLSFTIGILIS